MVALQAPEQYVDFKRVPVDVYECVLEGVTSPFPSQFGDVLQWKFRIVDGGEFDGQPIGGRAGAKLTKGSKNRAWTEGLLGRPIQDGVNGQQGEMIDYDAL